MTMTYRIPMSMYTPFFQATGYEYNMWWVYKTWWVYNAFCWQRWYIYIPPRRRSIAISPSLPSSPRWGAVISKSRSAVSSKPSTGGQYHPILLRWDEHTNYVFSWAVVWPNTSSLLTVTFTRISNLYLHMYSQCIYNDLWQTLNSCQ